MFLRSCLILAVFASLAHSKVSVIPITPGDEPAVVTKVRVTDCRAVRGFIGAPVDGSTASGSWDGRTWEYPQRHTDMGVMYTHMNADGLHITLADAQGFNAVVVRGGAKTKLLRDVKQYDQPETGTPVHEFSGDDESEGVWFDEPVKTRKVSFFNVSDGAIADASFYRMRRGLGDLAERADALPVKPPATTGRGSAIDWMELTSLPLEDETAIAAVGIDMELDEAEGGRVFTISVRDPLNDRLLLHDADYSVTGNGRVRIVCDFADQVVPAGKTIAIKITFPKPAGIRKIALEQYRVPKEQALPEALEHRKFILHAIYTPVSEARPWNIWNNPGDDEKYFAQPADTGDVLQDRLRPWVREIVMTLEQCRAFDPEGKDPIVRQMHQWIYRKILSKSPGGMPKFDTKFAKIEGVPEWASLVHQAWMQAREVPRWWMENRLAPNGEFGGLLADDSDMYQNYAPFPMLERDPQSVGGKLLDAAARMGELLDQKMLKDGINKRSMDPLHAYEEGMNHESLMAYWNYGDPIYIERCMAAARSTEPLTMMTENGHRHFRSNELGWNEIAKPQPPEGEHGSHCLMWHPTLMVAWYNRNPSAMKWLSEWGGGWLDHMPPLSGDHATRVKLPEDVSSDSEPLPFQGGWGMTGSVFTFLADLTADPRFVRPYTEYFATEKLNTGVHYAEIAQLGIDVSPVNDPPWNAVLYTTGEKKPFTAAIRKDIEELQRFPYMYTAVECFTDRVFLYAMINPSIAYTGGYTTRNKLNLNYAITYDGFGTDYAALVTAATRDHLKVLLCNVSDSPISGWARLWRLEPGEYELTFGPDANNDDRIDTAQRTEMLSIHKGDEITLTLPPKTVHVLELKQKRKDEPIFNRADLAIAQRELKIADGKVTGVVHNIGGKDVENVVIALHRGGKVVAKKSLGSLAAPLDLQPKTIAFELEAGELEANSSIVVDPDNAVAEIFEGNNVAPIDGSKD